MMRFDAQLQQLLLDAVSAGEQGAAESALAAGANPSWPAENFGVPPLVMAEPSGPVSAAPSTFAIPLSP